MASVRMDLRKCCFFVLSGVSNALGDPLAEEMCRYFNSGSVIVLVDIADEPLQMVRKSIEDANSEIRVLCFNIRDWQEGDEATLKTILTSSALQQRSATEKSFELAFIIHNEGYAATRRLVEPQDPLMWQRYVKQRLHLAIALNQQFIKCPTLTGIPKLVVNITSSLRVQPLMYNTLLCSCKKTRDMYFHSMAAEEKRNSISVLNYSPGIFLTHLPENDINSNTLRLEDVAAEKKHLKIAKVQPLQATLQLINILQELSFISGHDVDYYDTYVL